MRERGFTLLEGVVALLIVGLGVTALTAALSQARRTERMTSAWAEEERRATDLLFSELRRWEQLRTEPARQAGLRSQGEDARLGAWGWQAEPMESSPGQAVGLYRVRLAWRDRQVSTVAALRILQG